MSNNRTGTVVSLNRSDGGVPKHPVSEARVTIDGMEGDRQRNLNSHGGPERALCRFAVEVIERLRNEGHPVGVGSLGENVTVSGLNWRLVQPGAHLEIGETSVVVTAYAFPCRNIAPCFSDGRFVRVSPLKYPGDSRLYARVLRVGRIRAGDPVILMSPSEEGR